MSKNHYSRPATAGKNLSLIAGILIGMTLGLIIAAGIAWYVLETPSSFVNNVPHETTKLTPEATQTPPAATTGTSAAPEDASGDGKPRFEFYKVLTDKQDATATPAPASSKPPSRAAASGNAFFLQVGSFANMDEAEKLKARLAMLGMEALVQDANVGDKLVHRVRLGPYSNEDEMKEMQTSLKQNGIDSTPTRAQ